MPRTNDLCAFCWTLISRGDIFASRVEAKTIRDKSSGERLMISDVLGELVGSQPQTGKL